MKNHRNLMRFDLITAVCSAGSRPTAVWLLIAAAYLILVFLGVPLLALLLFIAAMLMLAPLQGIAEKNNFNKLYGLLPVPMKQIIQARFLLIFVSLMLCELAVLLLGGLSELLNLYRMDISDSFLTFGMMKSLLMYSAGMFVFFLISVSYVQMMLWIHGQANEMKIAVYALAGILGTVLVIWLLMSLHLLPTFTELYKMLPKTSGGRFALYAVLHLIGAGVCAACCAHTVKIVAPREL